MPRKILSRNQQCYVVTRLACYAMPSQVRDEIRDEFGLVITTNALQHYDPTKYQGHDLDSELKDLFNETRELYRHRSATIAVGDKMHRLMLLQNFVERAMEKDDIRLALAVLAQAARETGGYQRGDCNGQASMTMNLSLEQEAQRNRMVRSREPKDVTVDTMERCSWEQDELEESEETTALGRIEPEVTVYSADAAEDERWLEARRQHEEDIMRIYGNLEAARAEQSGADETPSMDETPVADVGDGMNADALSDDETYVEQLLESAKLPQPERQASPAMIFLDPAVARRQQEQAVVSPFSWLA